MHGIKYTMEHESTVQCCMYVCACRCVCGWGVLFLQAGLVCGDHVFDVDERVLSSMELKSFQRLLNKVSNILTLLLTVVNAITNVHCMMDER